MRRKIKRRLFMVGMAMAAGIYAPAHAKGGGKLGLGGHDYSAAWSADQYSTLPFDQSRDVATVSEGLLGKFKAMLGGLDFAAGNGFNATRRNSFGLHSYQPEIGAGASGDPRLSGGHTGVALLIRF